MAGRADVLTAVKVYHAADLMLPFALAGIWYGPSVSRSSMTESDSPRLTLCVSFAGGGAAVAANPARNMVASATAKANRFITPVLIQITKFESGANLQAHHPRAKQIGRGRAIRR